MRCRIVVHLISGNLLDFQTNQPTFSFGFQDISRKASPDGGPPGHVIMNNLPQLRSGLLPSQCACFRLR